MQSILELESVKPSSCFDVEAASQRALVDWVGPVVRVRVGRTLVRWSGVTRRHLTPHDVEEVAQDVMALLFANNARILRSWDSQRGLSFRNYVGLVTERVATRLLQVRNRQLCFRGTERAIVSETEVEDSGLGPEALLAAREYVAVLVGRIRHELSPRGGELFELLILDERPVEEVCNLTGLSRDAAYTWRSRLARLARHVAREVENEEMGNWAFV
jgi:DNA-directed RNA polymerase specialized sigma24 family protein